LPGGHLELGITVSQAASEALEATVKLTPRVDAEEKQGASVQLVIPGQRAGSVSAGQSLTVGPVALDQEWSVQVTWVDKLEYELPLLLKADLEETADEDS
jgi:predicted TPR repeat methyltransferase